MEEDLTKLYFMSSTDGDALTYDLVLDYLHLSYEIGDGQQVQAKGFGI